MPIRPSYLANYSYISNHAAPGDHAHPRWGGDNRVVKRGALEGSRPLGRTLKDQGAAQEFQKFLINSALFLVHAFINRTSYVNTLINSSYKTYSLIDQRVANKLNLPRLLVK